jgi:hypothetical protein
MNMYIRICYSQMLVLSHNEVLQDFPGSRTKFFQKFSGNLTQEFLQVTSDGVMSLLLTASRVKIWKFYQFCFSNGVLKFC